MRAHEFINETTAAANKLNLAKQTVLKGGLTYYGDKCTKDCSGHRAGREWAIRKGVATPNQMPFGNSNSFYQGGVTYSKEATAAKNRANKASVRRAPGTAQPTGTL